MASFLHSGDLGDCVFALPTIKALGGGIFYLKAVTEGQHRTREPMTQARMEFLRPLLMAQEYITEVAMHKGEKIKYDFTEFRTGWVKDQTLTEWQRRHVAPFSHPKFDEAWLAAQADPRSKGRNIIARTARYHNPHWSAIWPKFANSKALFIGTKEEHRAFCDEFEDVEYIHVSNALEMASLIEGCDEFIGNQSLPNAIAEGLKHKLTLEVCPTANDCNYSRLDANRIAIASHCKSVERPKMMLALQCHDGDMRQALSLAKLISSFETKMRNDVEFAVFHTREVPAFMAQAIISVVAPKFYASRAIRSKRFGKGWPEGCNDLWQDCMTQIAEQSVRGRIAASCILTIEPDSCPITRDWLYRIIDDWEGARASGKSCMGWIGGEGSALHMNGNAVFDIQMLHKHRVLQSSAGSWDATHRNLLMSIGMPTRRIINQYACQSITRQEIEQHIANGVVLHHGCKSDDVRRIVMAMMPEAANAQE